MYSKGEGGKEEGGKERKKRDLVATSFQTSDSNHGLVCLRHVPCASTSLSVCVCVVLGLSLSWLYDPALILTGKGAMHPNPTVPSLLVTLATKVEQNKAGWGGRGAAPERGGERRGGVGRGGEGGLGW